MSENWESVHKQLGFDTETAMFQDLYINQKMSLHELKGILGVGVNTIRDHMRKCGVPTRPRGGKNRLGMSRVRTLPDDAFDNPEKAARVYGFHPSAIYKEKRRRKEERERGSQSGASPEVSGGELASEQDQREPVD